MIYLDNASTTHTKPRCVVASAKKGLTKYSVNAGRGGYKLSILGGEKILDARLTLTQMFGIDDPQNVIFTGSCTHAINLALRGTAKRGGHIVITCLEHNSVLRTVQDLKKLGVIDYTIVHPNKDGVIAPADIVKALRPNTYLVVTIHISNVTGATNNIQAIGKMCAEHGLMYMVDCAQSAGHTDIDMGKCHINMLTIAGHKGFYAPQGIGALLLRDVDVTPIITGGTGTHSDQIDQPHDRPEGLESGTLSLSNIMALHAGAKYVCKHKKRIYSKNKKLTSYLLEQLNNIPGIKVYSSFNDAGVVSFNIRNIPSSTVSDMLWQQYGICVRSGLQCAPLVHRHYGTLNQGMVRVSIGYFNTKWQISKLIQAVKNISNTK